MNGFFTDKSGAPVFLHGLQAHNSSTNTPMLEKAIQATKLYGGNVLEAPVYWFLMEPKKDEYDLSHIKTLIDQCREAGLFLIILWFATSKNGHPNYAPEYIKLDPERYLVARGADGFPLVALSPHCEETLQRDAKAFAMLMSFLKEYDGEERTVLSVQIENEMGLGYTDRDYSQKAQEDYKKPVPEILRGIELEDMGERDHSNAWRGTFGRHAHEAFCAYYHARFIGRIAEVGKAIYDIPLITNVMVGENGIEEPGKSYNAGAAVGRVLDIWKAAAPKLDLICPDIYNAPMSEYTRICSRYTRDDNALFIPESPTMGEHNAINVFRAVANYGAIGVCGFGAESALANDGSLQPQALSMALSMRVLGMMAPLIEQYRNTGKIHAIIQEEFATRTYLKLENYHVLTAFTSTGMRHGLGSRINMRNPENQHLLEQRGRALLVQSGEHEFYLSGVGIAVDFVLRPDPKDESPYGLLGSKQATQLNFLSVEEGHFENGEFVCDFIRNGDESNFGAYCHGDCVVRIRLNPNKGF